MSCGKVPTKYQATIKVKEVPKNPLMGYHFGQIMKKVNSNFEKSVSKRFKKH